MDFNTQNQTPNQGMPMGSSGMSNNKKMGPAVLIIVAIAVLVLVAAAYLYMQGFINDYQPSSSVDYKVGDKITEEDKTGTTDAGPEIMLGEDTTGDIQSDIDRTNLDEVDGQFMEIDKDLQSL